MSFNETLQTLLKSDPRFVDQDGDLLKSEVIDKAWKIDRHLIELLLDNEQIKAKFFDEIKGHWVFNINTFIDYVQDKNFYASSYTKFRNKIGLTIDGKYLKERGEVALVWPYKDCILEGGQTKEEEKRREIFFNEVLAQDEIDRLLDPKVLTNFKRYTMNGEEKVTELKRDNDGTIRENLIIKGNNLLALHSLKEQFRGKVKLIYLDPPYNTPGDANTFGYNNTFNHSTWLTFMSNRINISKELLRPDGILAIAIDDEEHSYLKIICDEIFSRENYMGTLVIQNKPSGRTTDAYFATCHEYVLFYSREKGLPEINFFELTEKQKREYKEGQGDDSYKWRDFLRTGGYSTPEERPNSYYPIYFDPSNNHISLKKENLNYIQVLPVDSEGKKRVWRKIPSSFIDHVNKGEIKISRNNNEGWKVQIIDKIKKGIRPKSVWIDSKYDSSSHGTKLLKKMFSGEKLFSFPKSIYAVQDIIDIFTERGNDDIVLDFFAGSGTTAHAILELNKKDEGSRQFILCEQLEYIDTVTVNRVKKIIEKIRNVDFVYFTLLKYNEAFIEHIRDAEDTDTLLSIWEDMKAQSFLNYNVDINQMDANIAEFKGLTLAKQKEVLLDILNKNQLYVNRSEINDEDFKVSKEDKNLNKLFYGD